MATITHTKVATLPQNDDYEISTNEWNANHTVVLGADENFATNAQIAKIDAIVTNGDGSKFLANDGTYKTGGGGGVSNHEDLDGLQGGTTGEHVHLTNTEYEWLHGQLPTSTYAYSYGVDGVLTKTQVDGDTHPVWQQLILHTGWDTYFDGVNSVDIRISDTAFNTGDSLRFLETGQNWYMVAFDASITISGLGTPISIAEPSDITEGGFYFLNGTSTEDPTLSNHCFLAIPAVGDFLTLYKSGAARWTMVCQSFIGFMQGELAWAKVDKTGAAAGDVNAVPQSHCTNNNVPSGFIDHTTSTITLTENVGAVNDTFAVTITGTNFPVYINGTLFAKNNETITQVGALSKRYYL